VSGQPAIDQHEAVGGLQEVEVDLGVTEPGDARGRRRRPGPMGDSAGWMRKARRPAQGNSGDSLFYAARLGGWPLTAA